MKPYFLTLLAQFLLAGEPLTALISLNRTDPVLLTHSFPTLPDGLQVNFEKDPMDDEPASLFSGVKTQWNSLDLENNGINCIAVAGEDLYVGGDFQDAGGNPDADFIARWDGCHWHALGKGLNGVPGTIQINGSDIYVGGYFTSAGEVSGTSYIARWNGSHWQPVGDGLNAHVKAMAFSPEGIVVAGGFTDAGGNENADQLAIWTGAQWKEVGTPVNGTILDIEVNNHDIYICGDFINAGDNPFADYIAKWDGIRWQNLGTATNRPNHAVLKLAMHGGDLYAGGQFTITDNIAPVYRMARFNGSAWHAIGSYFSSPGKGTVTAVYIADHYVYVGVEKSSFDALVLRCDLNTEEWIEYPSDYPGNSTIGDLAWNGSDLFVCANNGYGPGYGGEGIWRWGIPYSGITITGVPEVICKKELPLSLPVVQDGYTGTWAGWGVNNNVFNPVYSGDYDLMFDPENGTCAESILFRIRVSRDSIAHNIIPNVCEINPPIDLSGFPYDISGVWSGPGVSNNAFDPAGLSGTIVLSFSPDSGQCVQDTFITIQVHTLHIPEITGVPGTVCETDPPVCLPGLQDSIPGLWGGIGVSWSNGHSHFNPSGLHGFIELTFYPGFPDFSDGTGCGVDAGFFDFFCLGRATITIQVLDSSQCSCATHAGSIGYDGSAWSVCMGTKFSVLHNGDDHLEQDDVINYILHDQPGNQLGNIYGVSLDGVFSFPLAIVPETTYYISAIAGSNDCYGYVNQIDPCLSISTGVPVIFQHCIPTEDNFTHMPVKDDPFDRQGKSTPLIQASLAIPQPGHSSQEAISFPNMFAQSEKHTNNSGESILHIEPDAVIKRIHLYDFLGREILSRKDMVPYGTQVLWGSVVSDLSFTHGVLIYVAEIEASNGERRFKYGRIVSLK